MGQVNLHQYCISKITIRNSSSSAQSSCANQKSNQHNIDLDQIKAIVVRVRILKTNSSYCIFFSEIQFIHNVIYLFNFTRRNRLLKHVFIRYHQFILFLFLSVANRAPLSYSNTRMLLLKFQDTII